MANINDALKRLFLKLGGDPDDLKDDVSVEDYIDNLGEVLCGAELPPVSGSDNGKVLTVSSGKWAAKQPASPTSYKISVGYNDKTPSSIGVSLPSGYSRSSLLSSGKAIEENTYVYLHWYTSDNVIMAYLPCISSSYGMGSVFEGIIAYTSDNANVFKRVVIFLSANTHDIPDAIKIEDFSFEST